MTSNIPNWICNYYFSDIWEKDNASEINELLVVSGVAYTCPKGQG